MSDGKRGYELVRKIGQGSFGIVNLCKPPDANAPVVVKEINLSQMADEEKTSAQKEADVMCKLGTHPFLVHYIESFLEANILHIVMEFCEGGDLAEKIQKAKKASQFFKEEQVMKWFVQMAFGLEEIHRHNILHRDLKSQNIFLTANGDAKIGDFGISKVLTSETELAQTVIGTPYYLSPEICEGRPYSKSSDIWSLGCILYEVVTLRRAFTGKNLPNLVLKILRGKYPPIPAHYSKDLRRLIQSMLQQDPRKRPIIDEILALDCSQRAFTAMGFGSDDDTEASRSVTSDASPETLSDALFEQKEIKKSSSPKSSAESQPATPSSGMAGEGDQPERGGWNEYYAEQKKKATPKSDFKRDSNKSKPSVARAASNPYLNRPKTSSYLYSRRRATAGYRAQTPPVTKKLRPRSAQSAVESARSHVRKKTSKGKSDHGSRRPISTGTNHSPSSHHNVNIDVRSGVFLLKRSFFLYYYFLIHCDDDSVLIFFVCIPQKAKSASSAESFTGKKTSTSTPARKNSLPRMGSKYSAAQKGRRKGNLVTTPKPPKRSSSHYKLHHPTSYSAVPNRTKSRVHEDRSEPSRLERMSSAPGYSKPKNIHSKVKTCLTEEQKRQRREWLSEQEEKKRKKRESERHRLAKFKSGISKVKSRIGTARPNSTFLNTSYKLKPNNSEGSDKIVMFQDGQEVESVEDGRENRQAFRQPNFEETPSLSSGKKTPTPVRSKKKKSGVSRKKGRTSASGKRMREFMAQCKAKYNKKMEFELVLAPRGKGPGEDRPAEKLKENENRKPASPRKEPVKPTTQAEVVTPVKKIEDKKDSKPKTKEDRGRAQRQAAREKLQQNVEKVRRFCMKILGEELYQEVYNHLKNGQAGDGDTMGDEALKKLLKPGKQWACIKHMNGIIYCEHVIASTKG